MAATARKSRALQVVPISRREKKEAAEALQDTSQEFLECRDLHHPWTVVGMYYVGSEVHRKLLCERCGTEATDRWTGRGERIRRGYKYAEGYKTKGIRITPLLVRREVLNRVTVYPNEEQLLKSLFSKSPSRRKRA